MTKKGQKIRHIAKSILIAFSIAIVYFVVGNIVLTGAYAELFHLLVAIGLFFGSIIFYFVFIFFRSIKKLHWLFGGIVVYISIIALANSDLDIYVSNLFQSNSLPKQYEQYQDINQVKVEFEHKEMTLLIDGNTSTEVKPYLTLYNNLIISKNIYHEVGEKKILQRDYYKLDPSGTIVATYKVPAEGEFFKEGYFINIDKNYYNSWAIDGDTIKHKIDVYNATFGLDKNEQEDFIANIEQKASFLFSKEYYEYEGEYKKFDKLVYFENNKWSILYSDTTTLRAIKSKESKDLFRYYSPEDYEWIPNENANIQYQYYQKQKLDRSKVWSGYLYTNVVIGKDTLKIKEAVQMDNKWKNGEIKIKEKVVGNLYRNGQSDFIPYLYYANPNISYQLFTNKLSKLYIIKNK